MWKTWQDIDENLVDYLESAEDGHGFTIINIEEELALQEMEKDTEIIRVLEDGVRNNKEGKKHYLEVHIDEIKGMHAGARRLRNKARQELDNALRLQKQHKKTLKNHMEKVSKQLVVKEKENEKLRKFLEKKSMELASALDKCKKWDLLDEEIKSKVSVFWEIEQRNKELERELQKAKAEIASLNKRLSIKYAHIASRADYFFNLRKKSTRHLRSAAIGIEQAKKEVLETITRQARKAGQAKQSPYEKAGTIAAVNNLLREKQSVLTERGGKARMNRMILDLIANGAIPAPDTPTPKTIDSWIDKFKKTEMS